MEKVKSTIGIETTLHDMKRGETEEDLVVHTGKVGPLV